MVISFIGNILFLSSLVFRKRQRANIPSSVPISSVYKLHGLFFILNLMSDALLLFEFTQLGVEHVFPYGVSSCLLYQNALKLVPIVQGSLVVLVAYLPIMNRSWRTIRGAFELGVVLLSIPTTFFSTLHTYSDGKKYCEVLLGSSSATSAYHLLYLAFFSYWLPLLLSLYPIVKLGRYADKNTEISVTLSTISSYFVLYFLHAVVVTTRYSLILLNVPLTDHQIWMMKVAQSLTWLIAYFWHFVRPSLIIVLDLDVKDTLSSWFCRTSKNLHYGTVTQFEDDSVKVLSAMTAATKIHTVQENHTVI
ncbi:uncharacterized protein [Lepeophtheirus salmonis]|nr:uncharacterized protein LOC121113752 [Lepeophtheirus salmonis]